MFTLEDAMIHVKMRDGKVDFKAIESALFKCQCIPTVSNFIPVDSSEAEFVISVAVLVLNEDWKKSRQYFEDRFREESALNGCVGRWVILRDDWDQWFKSE